MEKAINAFWWGNGSSNKGVKWMSWERLCAVKEDGGLGFKRLRSFNVAMLAKQAWRLVSNANPLVTQLMRARYFPNGEFLTAKIGNNPSFVWRSLLEAQDIIRQGCRRRIGDGLSTKIWQVPWLPCVENGFVTTEMPAELEDGLVHGLLDENQEGWDDEILDDIFNERDKELIRRIPVSRRKPGDNWLWMLEDKGDFSVKSCYRRLIGEADCVDKVFWRRLWRLKLPGKVLNLIWRACRSCLPTAAALSIKGVQLNTVCSWCHMYVEDDLHVLFQCCFAREVWEKAGLLNLVTVRSDDKVLDVLRRSFQLGSNEQILMVGLLCWNMWQRRNSWVWSRVNMSSFGVRSRAYGMLQEWQRAREKDNVCVVQQLEVNRKWCKPPPGWVKINTDAACMPGSDQVGVGCVVRDEWGNFLRARNKVVQGKFQVREAEAIGLKEALIWTREWRGRRCVFECDAKVLVDAVKGDRGNTYFHMIVEDCKDILKHFEEVLVCYAHRSANNVAHSLARATYSMSGLTEWNFLPRNLSFV